MAITYFGSASSPVDNGSNTGPTATVTPPGSMLAGDLVLLVCQDRPTAIGSPIQISETGGQTWTNAFGGQVENDTENIAFTVLYCRFNGTWSANPSITVTSGTRPLTAVMHVFRPSAATNLWGIDHAHVFASNSASGDPPPVPVAIDNTTYTLTNANTVTLAMWFCASAQTWSNLSGSGWVVTGSAQYRNTSGSDQSLACAHNIKTSASALDDVLKSVGADVNNYTSEISFYEYAASTFAARVMMV